MLKKGDKVAIVACSNILGIKEKEQVAKLEKVLIELGLQPIFSNYLFEQTSQMSGNGLQKAEILNNFYNDKSIKAVFDISGGDIANELLDFIDFILIKKNPKPFFGYSDLTTIINAIYTKTGNLSYLYQIKCLVWENKEKQTLDFKNSILNKKDDLYRVGWKMLRGTKMEGIVIGGNIRCFLKLAGTPYLPDFNNKILFLESYGGGVAQMITYFYQLKQMGVFEKIAGLLLGTFSNMEEKNECPSIEKLVLQITDNMDLPIAKTQEIGHGNTSKCLIIGKNICIADR